MSLKQGETHVITGKNKKVRRHGPTLTDLFAILNYAYLPLTSYYKHTININERYEGF